MIVHQHLTKENFWNQLMIDYPNAMKLFCKWIDDYKKAINWGCLFGANQSELKPKNNITVGRMAPKFHDIPYEMQQGIWIRFAEETLNKCFEQPEYTYSNDLSEDIKIVFKEIEPLIDEETIDE